MRVDVPCLLLRLPLLVPPVERNTVWVLLLVLFLLSSSLPSSSQSWAQSVFSTDYRGRARGRDRDAYADADYSGDRPVLFQESFQGVVGAHNYSHFAYTGEGKLRLRLESLEGDADLYVAEKRLEANYELDGHSLQSTTCGVDTVEVPPSFKRPIGIGVYGHPSYLTTRFSLEVIGEEVDPEVEEEVDKEWDKGWDYDESYGPQEKTSGEKRGSRSKEKWLSWELIISLLEGIAKIIIEILT